MLYWTHIFTSICVIYCVITALIYSARSIEAFKRIRLKVLVLLHVSRRDSLREQRRWSFFRIMIRELAPKIIHNEIDATRRGATRRTWVWMARGAHEFDPMLANSANMRMMQTSTALSILSDRSVQMAHLLSHYT